jgi:hypothetical protein
MDPAGQGRQDGDACVLVYVPAAQGSQWSDWAMEKVPGRQSSGLLLGETHMAPAGQGRQALMPLKFAKVPEGQGWHVSA